MHENFAIFFNCSVSSDIERVATDMDQKIKELTQLKIDLGTKIFKTFKLCYWLCIF